MDPRIQVALGIIDQQAASSQVKITGISQLLGISETYLLGLFRREVGKSFRHYLRDVRMARAAELLKDSARSIKGIASECGYSDVSNFYRDFKRVYGHTPRQIRFRAMLACLSQDRFDPGETASAGTDVI